MSHSAVALTQMNRGSEGKNTGLEVEGERRAKGCLLFLLCCASQWTLSSLEVSDYSSSQALSSMSE